MIEGDNLDWEFWEPIHLFEENLNLPQYARIREADNMQRHGYGNRAQPIYSQECKRCDKTVLETCAALHEAESHRTQGEWNEAIEDYWRAFECLRSNDQAHNIAMTHLMLGLCYQAVANYREALEQFTQAHKQFDWLLQKHRGQGNRRNVGKYSTFCMQALLLQWQARALANAVEASAGQSGDELHPLPVALPGAPEPNYPISRIWIAEEGFEEIPVLETEVAAFALGRGYEGERQIGAVYIGSVIVKDDEQYLPIDLIDGNNHLNLDREHHYRVIRVRGQSMNRAKPVAIEDGAWIVVRVPKQGRYTPEDETIVIANIPEISAELLLIKRISITDAVIFLKSESSEPDLPEHQTRSFPRLDSEEPPVLFMAQAVAVLKPLGKVA